MFISTNSKAKTAEGRKLWSVWRFLNLHNEVWEVKERTDLKTRRFDCFTAMLLKIKFS